MPQHQRAADVRLDKRQQQMLTGMVMTGSSVVKTFSGTRAAEIGAHRFLDHPRVTPDTILAEAVERTRAAAGGGTVLVLQDTTEVNFSGADSSRSGLGPGADGKARGFFIHAGLAVDLDSEAVLGVAHARIWTRPAEQRAGRKRRPIEDKESRRWLDATAAAGSFVGVAAAVIDVSDREGDIYQHFTRRPDGVDLVVRARHDRKLADDGGWLFGAAAGFGKGFARTVEVPPRGPGDRGRTAKALVRHGTVTIARPDEADRDRDPPTLTLGLIEVSETDPPAGAKPLLWRILTTLPVDKPHAVDRIIGIYRLRWRIEQLFRSMKSQGLKLEDTQVEAARRLFNLSAMALVAAARVMMLVDARDGSARPATDLVAPHLIEAVAAISAQLEGKTPRQRNPHPQGSLAWLAWPVARLGGWNCYYAKPGPKTMAAGWARLAAMLDGIQIAGYRRNV